ARQPAPPGRGRKARQHAEFFSTRGGAGPTGSAGSVPGVDATGAVGVRPVLGRGPPDAASVAPALVGGGRPAARPRAVGHGNGANDAGL
ncbi:MAG: hypothetical protein AVDCRST_MAG04-1938, partial [uncultured Acetobacteraceae bacterium]